MYGKAFASMYTGSLFGSSPLVFAVWNYVLANQRPTRDGEHWVELTPALLAATFSTSPDDVMAVIKSFCEPDPASRTPDHDGRRLLPASGQPVFGPEQYRVVNGPKYRNIRDEDDRREYLKLAKRKERARKKNQAASTTVNNVNSCQPASTQVEAEAEADAEAEAEAEADPKRESARAKAARLKWSDVLKLVNDATGTLHNPSPKNRQACETIAAVQSAANIRAAAEAMKADGWARDNGAGAQHFADAFAAYLAKAKGTHGRKGSLSGSAPATPRDQYVDQPLGRF